MEHDPLGGGCNTLMSLSKSRELREHGILVIRHGEILGESCWKVMRVQLLMVDGWGWYFDPGWLKGLAGLGLLVMMVGWRWTGKYLEMRCRALFRHSYTAARRGIRVARVV